MLPDASRASHSSRADEYIDRPGEAVGTKVGTAHVSVTDLVACVGVANGIRSDSSREDLTVRGSGTQAVGIARGTVGRRRWPVRSQARMSLAQLGLLVVAVVLPATACAATADQARQATIRARVSPLPLFPSALPRQLNDESHATSGHGHHGFDVDWVACCDSNGYLTVAIAFGRFTASSVDQALASNRATGHAPTRVRVGQRIVWRFTGDISFGYLWRERGYGYFLSAHCCLAGHVTFGDLRRMLLSLQPLGTEWVGRTAQGHTVALYRSRAGLDYDIHWTAPCDDGSETPLAATQAGPLLKTNTHGGFLDPPFSYAIGSDEARSSIQGQTRGSTASGTFSASVDLADTGASCDAGTFGWTARRVR